MIFKHFNYSFTNATFFIPIVSKLAEEKRIYASYLFYFLHNEKVLQAKLMTNFKLSDYCFIIILY